jgi:hypothetical protein
MALSMTTLPFHATPCIINDAVVLRVYQGNRLVVEVPLRRRQAQVLAARLLNLALLPEYDAPVPAKEAADAG